MDKKRKRASFSPTITIEKPIENVEEQKEKPVLQQVVEVVVEEPGVKEEPVESATHVAADTTISAEELRRQIKAELLEEMRRERELERQRELEEQQKRNEIKESSTLEPAFVQAPHHSSTNETKRVIHIHDEEEPKEPEPASIEETVEEEPLEEIVEEESNIEEVPQTTSIKEEKDSEEQQTETVAELFSKNSETLMPEITVHKGTGNKGLLIWGITMVAIAIGVGGGLVIFTNKSNQTPNTAVPSPTPVSGIGNNTAVSPSPVQPTLSPKPTAKPVVKKDIKIQIQNGGGVAGAGSKMKALLTDKGYTVVDVGNASSYDYEETEIDVKESKASIRDVLEEDISGTYTVGKIETNLPESSSYDVRVIVGKK